MKKSFLSRAMSAAIAVPVALSQTLVVASFAVDENAVDESGLQTITIENFKNVPVADSLLSPITEVEKYAVYEKPSTWNETLKAWTTSQAGQVYTLDISKLTESFLTSDAWYMDMLEDIVNNPEYVSATAEIGLDDVTMVLDVDYPYEVAIKDVLQKQFAEKYPDIEFDFKSDSALDLTVTIKASTTALDDSKIPFEVTILDDKGNKLETVDAVLDYIVATLEQVRTDANVMVDNIIADYQQQLDDAQALKDEKQQLKNEKQAEKDAKVIEVDEKEIELEEKQEEKNSKQADVDEKQDDVDAKQAELDDAIANGGDVASAQKELADAQAKLEDAQAQLDDAQEKLDDARQQLRDAREKLADAQEQLDDAQVQLDDAQRQIDEAQQQLNEADVMAEGEIDNMINGYLDKIETARDKFNGFTGEYSGEYSAANIDEALQKAKSTLKNKFPGQANRINRIPNSIDDFANSNIYGKLLGVYTEVLNQISDQTQDKAYDIEITLDDILDFAKEVYDVTISGDVVKDESGYMEANGKVEGSLPEELTTDDLDYYYDYFNELFAPENKKVVEGSLKTEKVMSASGNGASDTLSGEATLEIKRVITLEVEDLEETTNSETTTTSDSNDGTTTTSDPNGGTTTTSDPNGGTTTTSDPNGGTTTTSDPNGGTTTTSDPNGGTTTTSDPNGGTTTTSDTTPTETTTTEPTPVNVKDIKFEVEGDTQGNRNFYFSHDPRPFEVEDLVKSAKVIEVTTVDGKEVEEEIDVDMSKISFGLAKDTPDEDLSPEDVVKQLKASNQPFTYRLTPLYIFYEDEVAETQVYVYIGVKGDTNLDGTPDAKDGTKVLIYSAEIGSGKESYLVSETNAALESFAWFLSDVTSESKDRGKTSNVEGEESSELDAKDSTGILVYSAVEGAGNTPDWIEDVLKNAKAFPKYSKAIHDWKVENQK